MDKRALATELYEAANKLRGSIDASKYKDYMLGFMFYKFLSDKIVDDLKQEGWTEEMIKNNLNEDDERFDFVRDNVGYFISYKNLFSTWIEMKKDLGVREVSEALSAFDNLVSPSYKGVYKDIFHTLQTGLTELGNTDVARSSNIRKLLKEINKIPMTGRQGYDVLGYVYEYLIGEFASDAGKKAGEFYTPHEASVVMSEIIAHFLGDRDRVEIYDPTSGSGSLLLNIGDSISKYTNNENHIKYYAQEKMTNTYNLTRMNLIMKGINSSNINVRCGDTLKEDWPIFDEDDRVNTYERLMLDAVVSNPPYSQRWEPEEDPRYNGYGIAPKSKADYAFLLHDLYHLKPDGIMAIVLPHGVLFRGGEEGEIRKNLVENNNIDAIIGLPANMFYGTGIPTIIMILRQKRDNDDILIIDASKGFVKDGKKNKLRDRDVKKITDTVLNREEVAKYSKIVSRDKVRDNDYNLNIPRYVDSSEEEEKWDILSCMDGGIPNDEIDKLNVYWEYFPSLREQLFKKENEHTSSFIVDSVSEAIFNNNDVNGFINSYKESFKSLDRKLIDDLIINYDSVNTNKELDDLSNTIFDMLGSNKLIDKYELYQFLADSWKVIIADLEIIQSEGFDVTKTTEPNMIVKTVNGEKTKVQDGDKGRIIPFEIIEEKFFKEELDIITEKEDRVTEIDEYLSELLGVVSSLDDGERILNEDGTDFDKKTVLESELKEALADVTSDEIELLKGYLDLLDNGAKKNEKIKYISDNPNSIWNQLPKNRTETYNKGDVSKYLKKLKMESSFNEGSFEFCLVNVLKSLEEKTKIKKEIKEIKAKVLEKVLDKITSLSDDEVKELLAKKWIIPLVDNINGVVNSCVDSFIKQIEYLKEKYEITLLDIESNIQESKKLLCEMVDDLTGNQFDEKGLVMFKTLLNGKSND